MPAAGGSSGDGKKPEAAARPTTAAELADRLRFEIGELHLSRINEIPDLRAVFYHDPDGWAVEDTSLDAGVTWCRHASYTWEIADVVAEDDFVVRYTPSAENPDCYPLGQPLVLHVTGRRQRDGREVLTGEYTAGLHVERTVCREGISAWPEVCGQRLPLPAPTSNSLASS